ncbi:MAG: class I SAM-dependent methyltransferase [Ignavibacteriaceae bacterium]
MKNNTAPIQIDEVKDFWNNHPCGSDTSSNLVKKKYYEEIENYRYSKIRSIKAIANFEKYKDKRVLEVGCGLGTDGRQFAKNGSVYFGINLDEGSTKYAKEAFELMGLKGEILQMNAEKMRFESNTFDHIYSHGVIHHSPNTEAIVGEMFRVLKPGGTITVMIYNKSSINYYFEIMFLRKIFRLLLYPQSAPKYISKITGFKKEIFERHRKIMMSEKMTKQKWISINTDGPDCPLAKVYNKNQASNLFKDAGFINIKNYTRYFNKRHYSYLGRLIPNPIADLLGNIAGWHRWIKATKPNILNQ